MKVTSWLAFRTTIRFGTSNHIGVGALPASLLFGAIWTWASPAAAFTFGAVLAAMAALLLTTLPVPTNTAPEEIQHA